MDDSYRWIVHESARRDRCYHHLTRWWRFEIWNTTPVSCNQQWSDQPRIWGKGTPDAKIPEANKLDDEWFRRAKIHTSTKKPECKDTWSGKVRIILRLDETSIQEDWNSEAPKHRRNPSFLCPKQWKLDDLDTLLHKEWRVAIRSKKS